MWGYLTTLTTRPRNAHKVKGHLSLQKGGCNEVHDIEDLVKVGQLVKVTTQHPVIPFTAPTVVLSSIAIRSPPSARHESTNPNLGCHRVCRCRFTRRRRGSRCGFP
ncbi:hypothetical protein JHK85_039140 [Glycine max]|nr:hypothetical protein JHK85_039140 [Glycine max]